MATKIDSMTIQRTTAHGWAHSLRLELSSNEFGSHVSDVALAFDWYSRAMGTERTGDVYVTLSAFLPSCGADLSRIEEVARIMRGIRTKLDKLSATEGYPSSMCEHAVRFWRACGSPKLRLWSERGREWQELSSSPADSLRAAVRAFEQERETAASSDPEVTAIALASAERAS